MGCLLVFPYKDKLMLLPPLTYLPERVPDFYPLLREVDVPCWVWSNVRVGADMFGVGDEANDITRNIQYYTVSRHMTRVAYLTYLSLDVHGAYRGISINVYVPAKRI